MESRALHLTDIDRRLIANVEALYGPLTEAAPQVEVSRKASSRPSLAGSVLRTIALVTLAAALLSSTEPGRTMYDALGDGARAAYGTLEEIAGR